MPVYYSKNRGTYFIRLSVGGRYFYCYKPDEPGATCFKRKKDAQTYEPIFAATLTESDANKELTCDMVAGLFLQERKAHTKPNTYYGIERTFLKYVMPMFRKMRIGDVTNAYLDTCNANLARRKKNVYQQACCIRSFVRFLKKTNPSLDPTRISTPKNYQPSDGNYQIYTEKQFDQLIAVVDDERDRFMLTLLFYYGLRCGELMGLKWSDFDGKKLHIRRSISRRGYSNVGQEVTTPKTKNSIRDYPILEVIKPYLQTLEKPSEWCFPPGKHCQSEKAVTIGHSDVRRRVDKYIEKAGLPHMKVHGFRHSCVSWLLSEGMSYRTVARWVGDTEAVVLQTYSHLVPDEKDQIADFLDKKKT